MAIWIFWDILVIVMSVRHHVLHNSTGSNRAYSRSWRMVFMVQLLRRKHAHDHGVSLCPPECPVLNPCDFYTVWPGHCSVQSTTWRTFHRPRNLTLLLRALLNLQDPHSGTGSTNRHITLPMCHTSILWCRLQHQHFTNSQTHSEAI